MSHSGVWECEICNFKTDRETKYNRHVDSTTHKNLQFLFLENELVSEDATNVNEIENGIRDAFSFNLSFSHVQDDHYRTVEQFAEPGAFDLVHGTAAPEIEETDCEDAQNPSPQLSEWYPFNSQAELLMYVFMNSPTHPVSEEVVKFVLYILEQLDVQDIPTLSRLKEKKFGVYSWENLVKKGTSKDNTPVWILKPSEILKLNVANPIISKKLVRSSIVRSTQTRAHTFLGASEKADIMDLARVVSDDITYLKTNGVPSFDATTGKNCIVKSCLDTVVADFQMLSHCCNHLGATALKYCPRCNVDRDHYMMLGVQRTPRQTKTICQRINIRSTEKEKKIMRKRYGVKEHDNVFWDLLDPHRDIPVGLLHLIPLGLAKHLIKTVIKPLDSTALTKMSCHLEALYPGSKFHDFFRYVDSRQGKDFKEYLQVAPFNMLYAGVQRRYIQMVSTLAAIQQKLNQSKFSESDIESLREDVRFYHQLIEENSPELKNKVKTHLLLHMIEDISRHGPPTGYDEDSFEKNHATIRNLLFLQNQKARSRDTSIKFAKNYLCRHVLSGGYFEDQDTWKQASINVQNIGEQQQIKKFLGLARAKEPKRRAGSVTMLERHQNKHPILTTQSEDVILHALITLNIETNVENYTLNKGNAVTAQNKDLIHKGEWLRYLDENMQLTNLGYSDIKASLVHIYWPSFDDLGNNLLYLTTVPTVSGTEGVCTEEIYTPANSTLLIKGREDENSGAYRTKRATRSDNTRRITCTRQWCTRIVCNLRYMEDTQTALIKVTARIWTDTLVKRGLSKEPFHLVSQAVAQVKEMPYDLPTTSETFRVVKQEVVTYVNAGRLAPPPKSVEPWIIGVAIAGGLLLLLLLILLLWWCGFFRRKRPEDAISASQKPLVYKNGSQTNYGNQQMYGNPSGYGNDLMSRPYE